MPRVVPVELPAIIDQPGVKVRAQLVGDRVHHVVTVKGGSSRRETEVAIERARQALRNVPEQLREVEILITPHSEAQMQAAEEKRARKAAKRAGRP